MPDSHRIASRDGLPFDFSDGLKIAGFLLNGVDGGKAIKVKVFDTDATPTDLYTWVRSAAASLVTLQANFSNATTAGNQSAGTNNTSIANTAFVTGAVATAITNILGAAPANLNTLQELAAAIGNDPAYSTSVLTALNGKLAPADMQKGTSFTAGASVGSTGDAISATFTTPVTALQMGHRFLVRTLATNTVTNPTFSPAPGVIAVKAIVKGSGVALAVGDIGTWAYLQYDVTGDRFFLLNPNSPATLPVASTTVSGITSLATAAEAIAGSVTNKAVTPAGVSAAVQAAIGALSGTFKAPIISGVTPYHEVGDTYGINMSATPIAPDTSIVRFEITAGSTSTVNATFATNSGGYTVPAAVTNGIVAGSSYLITVVAVGNTGTRSPAGVLAVNTSGVLRPTITFPTSNASNVSLTPTITATPFTVALGADIHAQSAWEVRDVNDVLIYSTQDAVNKTSLLIPANILDSGTNYQVRVRYIGTELNFGSEWSSTVAFSTTVSTAIVASNSFGLYPTPVSSAGFGYSLALNDQSYAAVGAPFLSPVGHVDFRHLNAANNVWSIPYSPVGTAGVVSGQVSSYFGTSVCLSKDGIRAAAAGTSVGSTSTMNQVKIFTLTSNTTTVTGALEAVVSSSDMAFGSTFTTGSSLACDANMTRLMMGTPHQSLSSSIAVGQVGIWVRTGTSWSLEVILGSPDASGNAFGTTVATDDTGTWLAVTSTTPIPKLFIYKRIGTAWVFVMDYVTTALIGTAMPVSFNSAGDRLIMGASSGNLGKGFVYTFDFDGMNWINTNILTDRSTVNPGIGFGMSVSLSGDGNTFIAGCPYMQLPSAGSVGKAVVYRYLSGQWVQDPADILPPAVLRVGSVYFGSQVTLSPNGSAALISAPLAYIITGQQASVYYYTL